MALRNKKNNLKDELKAVNLLSSIILEFSSGILIGLLIGWLIDKLFDTKPIFIIIFLIFGFAAGFLNIYRYIKKKL